MKPLMNLGRAVKRSLGTGTLRFGLREATLLAVMGIIISVLVAWSEIY